MKPKINRAGVSTRSSNYDRCQTPGYALDPLLPYLPKDWYIWECAAGRGNLVSTLQYYGYTVTGTDIEWDDMDFFQCGPEFVPYYDAIVTNPPYSVKYQWLAHCYELGKPFALLMPVEMIGTKTGARLFDKYGIEIIYPTPRINFFMPEAGYTGNGAQFPTAWYCWKLGIGQEKTFVDVPHHYLPFEEEMVNFVPEPKPEKMTDKKRIQILRDALGEFAKDDHWFFTGGDGILPYTVEWSCNDNPVDIAKTALDYAE